jgi:tyrosinase
LPITAHLASLARHGYIGTVDMHLTYLTTWVATAIAAAVPGTTLSDHATLEELAKQALDTIQNSAMNGNIEIRGNSCKISDIRIRRGWYDYGKIYTAIQLELILRYDRDAISPQERKDYITAVQCLQSKPAKTPQEAAPGAKTRFDDFVATHINQTMTIHYTANFLSWHRYFVWLYEEALRTECGYKGSQPVSLF